MIRLDRIRAVLWTVAARVVWLALLRRLRLRLPRRLRLPLPLPIDYQHRRAPCSPPSGVAQPLARYRRFDESCVELLVPIGIILGLSMGDTFRPIADLPLPLVNSERGPTLVAVDLYHHFDVWRLSSIESAFAHRPIGPAAIIWRDDPRYFMSLGAGWLTSVSTLVWLASRHKRSFFA